MTLSDWGWAVAGLVFGAFCGLVTVTMAALMVRGLWVLVLLALPILFAQLLFDFVIDSFIRRWKRWRGHSPPVEPVQRHLRTDLPWLRRYGFYIGFVFGGLYALVVVLTA